MVGTDPTGAGNTIQRTEDANLGPPQEQTCYERYKGLVNTSSLFFLNTLVIVFVVFSGDVIPTYQASFSIVSGIFCIPVFMAVDAISNRRLPDPKLLWKYFWHRDSALIGLMWTFNYVLLLISNPYVPGFLQIVFLELNLFVVVFLRRWWMGVWPDKLGFIGVGIVCIGGAVPFFLPQSHGPSSNIPGIVWYLIYLIGSVSICVANTRFECFMKRTLNGDGEPWESGSNVALVYTSISFWILIFVVALLWVPPVLNTPWSDVQAGFKYLITFEGIGALWSWLALLGNVLSTYYSGRICVEDSGGATFATIVLTFAPAFSAAIFAIPALGPVYYAPPTWATWTSLGITMVGVFVYKGGVIRSMLVARDEAAAQEAAPLTKQV